MAGDGGERGIPRDGLPLLYGEDKVQTHHRVVFLIMMLMGAGALFPWNAFITPHSFYMLLFQGSFVEHSFMSMLSSTFTLVGLVSMLVLQKLQHMVSLRCMVVSCLLAEIVIFAGISICSALLLFIPEHALEHTLVSRAAIHFVLLLSAVAAAAVAQAFLTGSVLSYASIFGSGYLKAVSGGMGIAGLAVALANYVAMLPNALQQLASSNASHLESRTTIHGALWYFLATCVVLLWCLASFLWLERADFTAEAKRLNSQSVVVTQGGQTSTSEFGVDSICAAVAVEDTESSHVVPWRQRRCGGCTDGGGGGGGGGGTIRRTGALLLKVWRWAFSLVLIYSVTIGVFPAVTGMLASTSSDAAWSRLFVPTLFVAFNVGDVVGRNLHARFLPQKSATVLALSLLRLAFFPLFISLQMQEGSSVLRPLIRSDAVSIIAMLALALSNGWLTTAAFMRAPTDAAPHERAAASTLMAGCLNLGLTCGALLSFFFHWLVCRCNPFVD